MPALSPTMSHGNIVAWHIKEGQEVAPGDIIAEVETDKASIDWENQDEGFVAKLIFPAGAKDIPVGAAVAIIVEEEDQIAAFKNFQPSETSTAAETTTTAAASTPTTTSTTSSSVEIDSRMGPAARHLLQESKIPLSSVHPTGPHNMVLKGDVLAAIAGGATPTHAAAAAFSAGTSAPAPPPPPPTKKQATSPPPPPSSSVADEEEEVAYTDIPTTQIRRIIAQRLLESKSTIPHLYLSADVELDGIAQLREALKSQGIKVSVNDCVIKAAALALAEVPAANSKWDTTTEERVSSPSVDISIAVATDGGLITPIVKNADGKSIAAIAEDVRDLAGRARANKLKPEEFQGGSFSISNLGMFGVDSFYAIINPPQACIMAVGGARKVAKMVDGVPTTKTMMTVTLSADNRVYDGGVASSLLEAFAKNMANPYRLLT